VSASDDDKFLSPCELAAYLGVPLKTVRAWRHRKEDPPAIKLGKHIRYRKADVKRWLESRVDPRSVA